MARLRTILMIAHHGEKLVGNLTGASLDRAILD